MPRSRILVRAAVAAGAAVALALLPLAGTAAADDVRPTPSGPAATATTSPRADKPAAGQVTVRTARAVLFWDAAGEHPSPYAPLSSGQAVTVTGDPVAVAGSGGGQLLVPVTVDAVIFPGDDPIQRDGWMRPADLDGLPVRLSAASTTTPDMTSSTLTQAVAPYGGVRVADEDASIYGSPDGDDYYTAVNFRAPGSTGFPVIVTGRAVRTHVPANPGTGDDAETLLRVPVIALSHGGGETTGWMDVADLAGVPESALASPATVAPTTQVAATTTPQIERSEPVNPGWLWLCLLSIAFSLIGMVKTALAVHARDTGGSGPHVGWPTRLSLVGAVPSALLVALWAPGQYPVGGMVGAAVTALPAGLMMIKLAAARRDVRLSVMGLVRALNNRVLLSLGGALLAGAAGWLVIGKPAGAVTLAIFAWCAIAATRAIADVEQVRGARAAVAGRIAAVLGIPPQAMDTVPLTVEPGRIAVTPPPQVALRLGDVASRVAQIMPEWEVTYADHHLIELSPVTDAEQQRRAHVAASGGLVAGVAAPQGMPGQQPMYGQATPTQHALVVGPEDLAGGGGRGGAHL